MGHFIKTILEKLSPTDRKNQAADNKEIKKLFEGKLLTVWSNVKGNEMLLPSITVH